MQRFVIAATVILAVGLASGALAGAASDEARIVGGVDATRPWPAQGALEIEVGASVILCGGTLVSGRWFLTAAHCVTDASSGGLRPADAFTVRLGNANRTLATAFEVSSTEGVIRHEMFNPRTLSNDLALLKLTPAVQPSDAIAPLRLVDANESALWMPGTNATIIGWGTTCYQGCDTTRNLQEARVPIVSDATCSSAYGNAFVATTMVCAGNGVTDTCQGDSGGPIMVPRGDAYVLVGVTSKGAGCAEPDFPGVYTRLGAAALNAWMHDRIPTVRIDSPALTRQPAVDEAVALSASGLSGRHGPPDDASYRWSITNLDGHCAFIDVNGANVTLHASKPGSCAITAQQVYDDGDSAIAREVITIGGSPPATPPPEPVAPAPPPAQPAEPPAPLTPPAGAPTPRLATFSVPKQIRVRGLLDGRFNVTVRCSQGCRLRAVMSLDAQTSRALGMTRRFGRSARVGSGSARRSKAGRLRLTVRIGRAARIGLRSARRGTLTLSLTVSHSKRTENHKRVIRLTR